MSAKNTIVRRQVHINADETTVMSTQSTVLDLEAVARNQTISTRTLESPIEHLQVAGPTAVIVDVAGRLSVLTYPGLGLLWSYGNSDVKVVGPPIVVKDKLVALLQSPLLRNYQVARMSLLTGEVEWRSSIYTQWRGTFAAEGRGVVRLGNTMFVIEEPGLPREVMFQPDAKTLKNDASTLMAIGSVAMIIHETGVDAVDLTTGRFLWNRPVEPGNAIMFACGEKLVLHASDREIVAVESRTGLVTWQADTEAEQSPTSLFCSRGEVVSISPPAVDRIPADAGTQVSPTLPFNLRRADVVSVREAKDGQIIVRLKQERTALLDSNTGEPIWMTPVLDRALVAAGDLAVLVAHGSQLQSIAGRSAGRIAAWVTSADESAMTGSAQCLARASCEAKDYSAYDWSELIADGSTPLGTRRRANVRATYVGLEMEWKLKSEGAAGDVKPGQLLLADGTLDVQGIDRGTGVWVDNEFEGFGPRRLTGLTMGPHEVSLAPARGRLEVRVVEVNPDSPAVHIDETWREQESGLTVISYPPGASVEIDGIKRGATPVTVFGLSADQEVDLRLSKLGHTRVAKRLRLQQGIQTFEAHLPYVYPSVRFGIGLHTASNRLLGWPAAAIGAGSVIGPPTLSSTSGRDSPSRRSRSAAAGPCNISTA